MNQYVTGRVIRLYCDFWNLSGDTLTDPTTVTLTVKDPAGTEAEYTYAGADVTKESTGVFYREFAPATVGIWHYAWTGTGTAKGLDEGSFRIIPSRLT